MNLASCVCAVRAGGNERFGFDAGPLVAGALLPARVGDAFRAGLAGVRRSDFYGFGAHLDRIYGAAPGPRGACILLLTHGV